MAGGGGRHVCMLSIDRLPQVPVQRSSLLDARLKDAPGRQCKRARAGSAVICDRATEELGRRGGEPRGRRGVAWIRAGGCRVERVDTACRGSKLAHIKLLPFGQRSQAASAGSVALEPSAVRPPPPPGPDPTHRTATHARRPCVSYPFYTCAKLLRCQGV